MRKEVKDGALEIKHRRVLEEWEPYEDTGGYISPTHIIAYFPNRKNNPMEKKFDYFEGNISVGLRLLKRWCHNISYDPSYVRIAIALIKNPRFSFSFEYPAPLLVANDGESCMVAPKVEELK